jgi:hypothetical protein
MLTASRVGGATAAAWAMALDSKGFEAESWLCLRGSWLGQKQIARGGRSGNHPKDSSRQRAQGTVGHGQVGEASVIVILRYQRRRPRR